MIKDVFQLSKKSWHMSMMKYIWGFNYYDFSHICPYFWLSVLNVVIILPIFLFKTTGRALGGGLASFVNWIGELHDQSQAAYIRALSTNPKKREKFLKKYVYCQSRRTINFYRDLYSTDTGLYHLLGGEISVEQRKKDEIEMVKKPSVDNTIRNKARIAKIISFVKPFIRVVLILAAIATAVLVGWLLYKFILFIVHIPKVSWHKILGVLLGFLEFVGAAAIIVLILYGVFTLFRKMLDSISCDNKFFNAIDDGFVSFINGIGKLCSIVYQMFKSNCPAINWEE